MSAVQHGPEKPAVVVHGLAHALSALALAGPAGVLLVSAADAASRAGAGWFLALVRQARAAHPALPCAAALDCGAQAGLALGAIRAGAEIVILSRDCVAFGAVASAAAEAGVALWETRPDAFDLAGHDPSRRDANKTLAAWLSAINGDKI